MMTQYFIIAAHICTHRHCQCEDVEIRVKVGNIVCFRIIHDVRHFNIGAVTSEGEEQRCETSGVILDIFWGRVSGASDGA